MRYILIFIFTLIPSISFAGLFDPIPSDESLSLLGEILGSFGNVLHGDANVSLQAMFDKFNWAIVSVGVMILGYTAIVSLVNTAQEGQVMGKKWSSIWVPLRSLFGILLMVPTTTGGYSLIQVTIMWIVVQGIGLADQIWGIVLDNLARGISASSSINPVDSQDLEANAKAIFPSVLEAAVCMKGISTIARKSTGNPAVDNSDDNSTIVQMSERIGFHTTSPNITGDGQVKGLVNVGVTNTEYESVCGSWEISAVVSKDDITYGNEKVSTASQNVKARALYDAKVSALSALFDAATSVARQIVTPRTGSPIKILQTIYSNTQGIPSRAVDNYVKQLSGQVKYVKEDSGNVLQKVAQQGKINGWVVAGSYYFALNRVSQQNLLDSAKTPITSKKSPWQDLKNKYLNPDEDSYMEYAHNTELAYMSNTKAVYNDPGFGSAGQLAIAGGGDNKLTKKLVELLTDFLMKIANAFFSVLNNAAGGEPLVALAILGQGIMFWCETLWLTLAAVGVVGSLIGACAALNPAFLTVIMIAFSVLTVIMGAIMIFYSVGVSIGIYLPMIPYIIYTGAVLGWMMLVIEAVVAGPIIALGIVAPSQDEIGPIKPALMILANIFLRPSLMLFGFIISAKLLRAIVTFVNFGFFETSMLILQPGTLLDTMTGGGSGGFSGFMGTSMFSILFIIIIYGVLVITLTNRVFVLIYALPDKILRYIGGQPESVGGEVEKMAGEAKGGFEKGRQQVDTGLQSATTLGMQEGAKLVDESKKKAEADSAKKRQ